MVAETIIKADNSFSIGDMRIQTKVNTTIVTVSGEAEHGKDTFSDILDYILQEKLGFNTQRMAFADEVKKIAIEKYGWDGKKDKAGRDLLQLIGDGYREMYGKDYWIQKLVNNISFGNNFVIISDTRYKNESEWFKLHGYKQVNVKMVRVNEDGEKWENSLSREQKNHRSEREYRDIDEDFLFVCKNEDDITMSAILTSNYLLSKER